jgi:hypothetical protein
MGGAAWLSARSLTARMQTKEDKPMAKKAPVGIIVAALSALAVFALPVEDVAALDRLPGAEIPIVMKFEQRPLSEVIGAMAAAGPFKVVFEGGAGEILVTVELEKQCMKQGLITVAHEYDLEYEVPKDQFLVVRKRAKGN